MNAKYLVLLTRCIASTLLTIPAGAALGAELPPGEPLPLRVHLFSPTDGQEFLAPATVLLAAEAGSLSLPAVQVEFFANDQSLGSVTRDPSNTGTLRGFRFEWENVGPGDYTLLAVATDSAGVSAASEPVHIRVRQSERSVVTVRATDDTAREQSPLIDSLPDTARIVFHRSGSISNELAVFIATSGTATPGEDYPPLGSQVVFPAGAADVELEIMATDNEIPEPEESLVVR
jgi:hypothetical protein